MLVLAHRGGSYRAPENTLASFRQALNDGADGFEFDVRLTQDGEPVVCHDEYLRRLTGVDLLIRQTTWKEIQKLRVLATKEQIPHLHDVFELLQSHPTKCFIELKYYSEQLITLLLEAIRTAALEEQVTIMAFSSRRRILLAVKQIAPTLRTNIITPNPYNLTMAARLASADIVSFGWSWRPVSYLLFKAISSVIDIRRSVSQTQQRGISVTVGIANSEADVKMLMRYGVDGIWTDNVPLARSIVNVDQERL